MNYLYDATGDKVGTYKFMKNKNMYGIRFFGDSTFANILLSIDAFDKYRVDMSFYIGQEINDIGYTARRQI